MSKNELAMKSRDMAMLAARSIDGKKGTDITIVDIEEKSSFADYLVLASGGSVRQIGAIADEVEEAFEKEGVVVKGIEGKKESGWILMDYRDIIVNVLTEEMRARYHIEKVWADCESISYREGSPSKE